MVGFIDWAPSIILATLVPIFAAILVFMLARIFESKHLDQAARTELVFAGSTVFIVIVMLVALTPAEIMLVSVGNSLMKEATGTSVTYTNLIDIAKATIQPQAECMRQKMGELYYVSTFFEMSSTVYIEAFMSEVSSGFIYKAFTERINNTTNILTFYTYIYYLMIHIMNFMKYTALGLFLPIGIILRTFPPTRGAGAYVMAFSIGLYFVFPLSYLMMNLIPLDYTANAGCNIAEITEETPSSAGFMDPSKPKEAESWVKRHMKETGDLLSIMDNYVRKLTVSLCLVPIMAMVITLSFVLSGTSLFGGNIPEVGRGLVKLI